MKISNHVAAAAVMLCLFLMGGVAGGITVALFDDDGFGRGPGLQFGAPGSPGRFGGGRPGEPGLFSDLLDRELRLTARQRDSIDIILRRDQDATTEAVRLLGPQLRARVDSTNAAIRGVLTGEQQVRFDDLLEEMRRGGFGPPPPPPRLR